MTHIIMSLDSLEKELLRRKMAVKMGSFLESGNSVSCVSGHFYDDLKLCELCQSVHAEGILVIKNRSGKKLHVAVPCLKEMIRFKVTDVEELPRWHEKMKELRIDGERRKLERHEAQEIERKRLEKKVIVRKRSPQEA